MPRYKEPFTVFPRKLKSGKTIFYYRTYSPDGERTTAHSTGKTNRTQAKNYCADLLAKGLLFSNVGMSFGVYAQGFFDDNSIWMADKKQAGQGKAQPIAATTLKAYRHNLDTFLLPFFNNIKLIDLRPHHIKRFRAKLIDEGYSNSVINLSCTCLKIIVSYAMADRLVLSDPFISVPTMYVNARTKDAFTIKELTRVFSDKWESNDRLLFSLIAAVTGMRISEIYAIRRETVFKNYIDVKDQIVDKKLSPVKDGERRKVRICNTLYRLIDECLRRNGEYAFTEAQDTYRQAFYNHLGMNTEERKRNKVTFHSMRRFLDTYLLAHNMSEIKVKSILGHSSGKGSMSERYANFRPEHFDDFAVIQEELIKTFLGG
jgi:integrase